jgi:hypothetical protein
MILALVRGAAQVRRKMQVLAGAIVTVTTQVGGSRGDIDGRRLAGPVAMRGSKSEGMSCVSNVV